MVFVHFPHCLLINLFLSTQEMFLISCIFFIADCLLAPYGDTCTLKLNLVLCVLVHLCWVLWSDLALNTYSHNILTDMILTNEFKTKKKNKHRKTNSLVYNGRSNDLWNPVQLVVLIAVQTVRSADALINCFTPACSVSLCDRSITLRVPECFFSLLASSSSLAISL